MQSLTFAALQGCFLSPDLDVGFAAYVSWGSTRYALATPHAALTGRHTSLRLQQLPCPLNSTAYRPLLLLL